MSALTRNVRPPLHASPNIRTDNHVNEYAHSSVYVARYHLLQGGGELDLARDLMEEIASSNSEEVAQATDLLKKVQQAIDRDSDDAASEAQVLSSLGIGQGQPGSIRREARR